MERLRSYWNRCVEANGIDSDGPPDLWNGQPSTLVTSCTAHSFTLATGEQILSATTPALLLAEHEILFVTCFWARSPSLSHLSDTLRQLSAKSLARRDGIRIRIRICLSSLSLMQKLFHTSSPSGHVYPPSTWVSKLGLPAPDELQGLDLQIKSIFIRPFSVMHPKFIIIDRKSAFLPSCNVSWEKWFEGCVSLEGEVVGKLVDFWRNFWGRNDFAPLAFSPNPGRTPVSLTSEPGPKSTDTIPLTLPHTISLPSTQIPALLLPSPHHPNPHFHPLPIHSAPPFPHTPLNTFLHHALRTATQKIYIQTPNLTAPPVLAALHDALARGVDVEIVTNRRMMVFEQLVTAGTLTEICVWWLRGRYRRLMKQREKKRKAAADGADEERGGGRAREVGKLRVGYYRALMPPTERGGSGTGDEPVKSHLKLTVVDGEIVVLGSGNMDRASWYTSQELGVAFWSRDMAGEILGDVRECLSGRVEEYYP